MTAEQFYESGRSPVLLPMQSHRDDKQRIFHFADAFSSYWEARAIEAERRFQELLLQFAEEKK